jgi:hypothetical protein
VFPYGCAIVVGIGNMTNGLYVRLLGEPPMPPADADFSFRIVFEKSGGDPRRIFDAASELIDGFEELDSAMTGIVDATIQPLMVLEDIEAGSIRVWLSSLLKKIDDQELREGEIKRAIGPALVEAKYAAIAWLDKEQEQAKGQVDELRATLRDLAVASDVRPLGDYPQIQQVKLIAALDTIQDAKRLLGPKDKLLLEAPHKETYEANLAQTWDPSEAIPVEKTTTEQHSEGEIILTIRKPDMTGQSKWQFTRGRYPVSAHVADQEWLDRFHSRRVPGLQSGDAMRCKVKFTYVFDDKGTMVEERIEITKVIEIIKGPGGEQLQIPF